MPFFTPQIDNPYPRRPWQRIDNFAYLTPLLFCRGIESVRLREAEDADYIVFRDYRVAFDLDDERREIRVPAGMLTDLASVPRIARGVVGRVGAHLEASIVHDFLYSAWQHVDGLGAREEDRRFDDELMLVAMKDADVSAFRRALIYRAVRHFGQGSFFDLDENRYWRPPDAPQDPVGPGSFPERPSGDEPAIV